MTAKLSTLHSHAGSKTPMLCAPTYARFVTSGGRAGQMAAACRGSLRRLEVQRAAIGQLHWSAAKYAPLQERALWDGLVRMYSEGLVEAVGVSNYGPKQMQKIHRCCTS